MNAIAIFDIGKTNKKLLLFDEQYRICNRRRSCLIEECRDEDGEACEDLERLTAWVRALLRDLDGECRGMISAFAPINFSAYGRKPRAYRRRQPAGSPLYIVI